MADQQNQFDYKATIQQQGFAEFAKQLQTILDVSGKLDKALAAIPNTAKQSSQSMASGLTQAASGVSNMATQLQTNDSNLKKNTADTKDFNNAIKQLTISMKQMGVVMSAAKQLDPTNTNRQRIQQRRDDALSESQLDQLDERNYQARVQKQRQRALTPDQSADVEAQRRQQRIQQRRSDSLKESEQDQLDERNYQQRLQKQRQRSLSPDQQGDVDAYNAKNSGQRRVQNVLSDGGASLLLIQASLQANYMILNSVVGSITDAIKYTVEYEAELKNLQAIANATTGEIKSLSDVISGLATTTKFSGVELTQAATTLAQAGFSITQIQSSLQAAASLAAGTGTTLANSVDILTSVIGVFNFTANDSIAIVDKITASVNSSKSSVEKLALGLQYAGNTAAESGVSFEELTASMATMSNAGIKSGSTLGTGMRKLITDLDKPSDKMVETLERLGISQEKINIKTQGFIGVIENLKAAGFSYADAIQAFDIKGAAAFSALSNTQDLERQYSMLFQTGAAARANAIQMDSLEAQTKRFGNSVNVVVSTGLGPFMEFLKGLVSELADLTAALADNKAALEVVGTAVASLAVSFGAVKIATLTTEVIALAAGLQAMSVGTVASASALDVLTVSEAGATAGATALSTAMAFLAANPVVALTLGLTAIIGSVILLNELNETAAEKLDRVTGEFNNAKSKVEELDASVKQIDESMVSLLNRQDKLTDASGNLQRGTSAVEGEIAGLNQRMIGFGVTIDSTVVKFSDLILRMQQAKNVAAETLLAMQQTELVKSKEVVTAQQAVTAQALSGLSGRLVGGSSLVATSGVSLTRESVSPVLGGASAAERKVILDALDLAKQISSGQKNLSQITPDENLKFAQALAASSRLKSAADQNTPGVFASGTDKAAYEKIVQLNKGLTDVNNQLGILAVSTSKVNELQASTTSSSKKIDFFKSTGLDKSILAAQQDATRFGSEVEAAVGPDKATDPVAIAKQANALIGDKRKRVQDLITRLKGDKSGIDFSEELQKLQATDAEYVRRQSGMSEAEVKRLKEIDAYNTSKEAGQMRGARLTGDTQKQIDIKTGEIKRKYDIKRGELGAQPAGSLKGMTLDEDEKEEIAQAIENIRNQASKAGRGAVNAEFSAIGASLEEQARMYETQAKTVKMSVRRGATIEDISTAVDKSLELIGKANEMKVSAAQEEITKARSKKGTTPKTIEALQTKLDAVRSEGVEALAQTALGFQDFFKKAIETTYGVDKAVKNAKAALDAADANFRVAQQTSPEARQLQDISVAKAGPVSVAQGNILGRQERDLNRGQATEKLAFDQQQILSTTAVISDLTDKVALIQAQRESVQGQIEDPATSAQKLLSLKVELEELDKAQLEANNGITTETKAQADYNKDILASRIAISQLTPPNEQDQIAYVTKLTASWDDFLAKMKEVDPSKILGDGLTSTLDSASGALSNFFQKATSGSESVSDAFKDMGKSILQSINKAASDALAAQVIKYALSGFSTGGSIPGGLQGRAAGGSVRSTATVRGRAPGGSIMGSPSMRNRDSVPILAMPGEFMMQKSAVNAIGQGYLQRLNDNASSMVAGSSVNATDSKAAATQVVNVWIVPSQNDAKIGPNDIIAVIDDNIQRDGSTSKLIKQIVQQS